MTSNNKPGEWRKIKTDYWDTTYRQLNPFMPPIRCPKCERRPTHQRTWYPDEYRGAVSITEFKCQYRHTWQRMKTHD